MQSKLPHVSWRDRQGHKRGTQIPFTICNRHPPGAPPRRPAPAEATSACLQPLAPHPWPAPPLLPTAGPFCAVCNLQHSLLRRCPHSASGPEQQRLRLCRAPPDTGRTPNWSFSSSPLPPRAGLCSQPPKQSMPNELTVRGWRGRCGLGPPPCLLMLPRAPQPSARAFCRGRGRRCPQALSFFFFFLMYQKKGWELEMRSW